MKIKRILKYVMMKYGSVTSKQTKTARVSNVLIRTYDVVSFNYFTGSSTQSISYDNTVDFKVSLNSTTSSNATLNLQGPNKHSVKTDLRGELHAHFPDGLYTYSAIDLSGNTASGTFSVPTTATVSIPSAIIPTSLNATVQAWLNKIGSDGYVYPTQAKVDVYTAAFNYADAQGLTTELDLLGLMKTENSNISRIPFIHSAGSSARFTMLDSPTFTANKGWTPGALSGYINTNWNPILNGVKHTLGNASWGIAHTKETGFNISFSSGVQESGDGNTFSAYVFDIDTGDFSQGGMQSPTSGDPLVFFDGTITSGLTVLNQKSGILSGYKNGVAWPNSGEGFIDNPDPKRPNDVVRIMAMFNFGSKAFSFQTNDYCTAFFMASGDIDQVKMNTFINMLLL